MKLRVKNLFGINRNEWNNLAKYGTSFIYRILAVLFFFIIFAATPSDAMTVSTGDYLLQFQTEPVTPIAGKETLITLKALNSLDGTPAQHGKILINLTETVDTEEVNRKPNYDFSTFEMLKEMDGFGNYEFSTVLPRHAPYYIDIAVKELNGKALNPPLRASYTILASPEDYPGLRLLFILSTVLIIFTAFLLFIRARMLRQSSDPSGINLLDFTWFRKIITWKHLQPFFQIPLLITFCILLFLAFFDIQDGGKNLSTKLIWTVWWTGVIFTFVFVGRLWCFMCPLGAVSEWISNAIKTTRKLPSWLRNVWLANLLFILLTWVDITLGVVGLPFLTGVLFLAITLIAVFISLLYERRSFCRHICPIGGLIGIYSMFSAVELRSKDCSACKSHEIKECYVGNERGRGCPMFELVPMMDSNNSCNFCGECIKSCSKNNISLRFRNFFQDAWTTTRYSLDEAALAIILVGVSIFVTGDMLEPWEGWIAAAMAMVPADLLGIEFDYTVEVVAKSALYILISLIIIPGAMFLASLLSNQLAGPGNHKGLIKTFTIFGYMFIPVGLSLHLAHNTGHLLNESGGVLPAVQRFINNYTPFSAGEPNWLLAAEPLVDPFSLYWIQMSLLLTFFVYSLYAGYRLSLRNYKNGNVAFRALVPMVLLSLLLVSLNVYLLNLPMAPRHIH
jgi:polyferredoxin